MSMQVYEKVYQSQAKYLINNLAPLVGINPNGWTFLGEGDNGVAFKKDNEVIKVTEDWSEAELYALLEGKDLEHMPKVYSIVEIEYYSDGHDNKKIVSHNSDKKYVWLVHMEFIKRGPNIWQEIHNFMHDEELKWFKHRQKDFDKLIEDVMLEYEEDFNYINFLEEMKEIYADLNTVGVKKCFDFKNQDSGLNAHGNLCFYDLRVVDVFENYEEPQPKRVKITDFINEAKKQIIKKYTSISIEEAAWIYLGYVIYDKKMRMHNWENDDRMGINYKDTIEKFVKLGLCEIVDTEIHGKFEKDVVIFREECKEVLEEKFGAKTLESAIDKCYDLKEYKNETYNISDVPLEYYLKKNPGLQKSMDRLSDLKTDWFNRWSNRTMDQIAKNRNLKQHNLIKAFYHFFPERVPQELTIYRGVKNFYDEYYNDPANKPYSSWSLEKSQGERFAKYHFTTHAFEKPHEADTQTVLKAKVNIDDILLFYGGDEAEVIMKNPVQNIEVIHKKGWD